MDITNWFSTKVQVKNTTLPRFFILTASGKAEIKHNVESISDYINIANIKWKWGKIPLKILMSKKINKKTFDFEKSNYTEKAIPILKSNLQKCIRRSKEKKAIRTAYQMLLLDPNALLRRLPIIYIEDVHIEKSFVSIIWYMIAVSKGYKLSQNDIEWILGIVSMLAKNNLKEIVPKLNKDGIENMDEFINLIPKEFYELNFNVIWALLIRYLYGGMKGDMKLILNTILAYKNKPIIEIEIIPIKISDKISEFKLKYILTAAVDFHCTNIIKLLLLKYKLDNSYFKVYKECIWFNRSSLTNKFVENKKYFEKHIELYASIKQDLEDISLYLIKKTFN